MSLPYSLCDLDHCDDVAKRLLQSPSTSDWLKIALRAALTRDCVDAAADAEALAFLLAARSKAVISAHTH